MNKSIIKKFGYYKDQDGIMNRYLRENIGWEVHLKNTRDFILQASESKKKTKAVLLGTGWLLDIPYSELSELFEEVIFVDIKHPRQITHKLSKFKNIKLIETDISGIIEPVYQKFRLNKKNEEKLNLLQVLPVYSEEFLKIVQSSDFIVSVNLLNQLDIHICDFIVKNRWYKENELNDFRRHIQNLHLELLPKYKSALITDFEEIKLSNNSQTVIRKNLIYIKLPNDNIKKWTWNFDTQKTYNQNMETQFKVIAFEM
jgi:hypothetical protein